MTFKILYSTQVALIYTGINGFLDDLEVADVKNYCSSLVTFLSTTKKSYVEIVSSTNQFTKEAEDSLKEIIAESKAAFLKSKA